MKSQNFKSGQKAFLQSMSDAVETVAKGSPDRKYNMAFGLNLDQPFVNKTSSEILSLLSMIQLIIGQFDDQTPLTLLVDVVEAGSITEQIAMRTKESYDAKAKLIQAVPDATEKAAKEAIDTKIADIKTPARRKK